MKKVWTVVLLCGVSCFLVSAAALALGYFGMGIPENHNLPAIGLILIATGSSGKRRTN